MASRIANPSDMLIYFKNVQPDYEADRFRREAKRNDFIASFPIEHISELAIEDYVVGKDSSFCRRLEYELSDLGSIAGIHSTKFGVWFSPERNTYDYETRIVKKLGYPIGTVVDIEEVFEFVKTAVVELLEAAAEKNYKALHSNWLNAIFKSKLLSTYFPDEYPSIFAKSMLQRFLNLLLIPYKRSDDAIALQLKLAEWKVQQPEFDELDIQAFSDLLGAFFGWSDEGSGHLPSQVGVRVKDSVTVSLNTILYGPPGTGKTYHAPIYAVAICEGKSVAQLTSEYSESKIEQLYEQYASEHLIEFVTFHQSYSYEDFIEGIKPVMDDSGDDVSYVIEEGVFKRLCSENPSSDEAFSRAWAAFEEEVEDAEERLGYLEIPTRKATLRLVPSGTGLKGIKADGTRIGYFNEPQCRNVYHGLPGVPKGGHDNYRKAIVDYLVETRGLPAYKKTVSHGRGNRVMIIDEINRGNISCIFGELITLIEDDKRIGSKGGRRATLPYSKEPFGIPDDVYILGTMNTADRSLTQLDTALRRRFDFVEMPPDSSLLGELDCGGELVDLATLLDAMNDRIEILRDREHMIGHSYLLAIESLDDLKGAFENKILPLLREHFYDDYENISRVLGCSRIVHRKPASKHLWSVDVDVPAAFEFADAESWTAADFRAIYDRDAYSTVTVASEDEPTDAA